jgi:hypothetical protein
MLGMLGRTVEGFRVTRLLGQGTQGSRFEVEHAEQGKAVLRVFDGYGDGDGQGNSDGAGAPNLSAFRQRPGASGPLLGLARAQRLCALSHRNVARIHRAGRLEPEGTPFLIEEQVLGESLKELLGRLGPLPAEEALSILGQAAAGLSALHQAGVTHGNLSITTLRIVGLDPLRGVLGSGEVKLTGLLLHLQAPLPGSGALAGDIGSDLAHLCTAFGALLGISARALAGEEPPGPKQSVQLVNLIGALVPLIGALQKGGEDDGAHKHSALQLYERIEAAVRKSGLIAKDDSTSLWVPPDAGAGWPAGLPGYFPLSAPLGPSGAFGPGAGRPGPTPALSRDARAGQEVRGDRLSRPPSSPLAAITEDVAVDDPAATQEMEPSPALARTESLPVPVPVPPEDDISRETLVILRPPEPATPAATAAPELVAEDDDADEPATVEIERLESGELLHFLPPTARSIDELVGPLEKDSREKQTQRTPALAEILPVGRRLKPRRPAEEVTRSGLIGRYLSGPGRWLLPLGAFTVVILLLAAWALWGQAGHRPSARIEAPSRIEAAAP